jgi:hypothetical protein
VSGSCERLEQGKQEPHDGDRNDQREQSGNAGARQPSPSALVRSTTGTQAIATLLQQRISANRGRYRYGNALNLFLDRGRLEQNLRSFLRWSRLRQDLSRLLDRDRLRRWNLDNGVFVNRLGRCDLSRGRILLRLSGKPRAATFTLFAVSLAFLVGAFAWGL